MKLPRVTEPDEKLVHFDSFPTADAVTLCGLTDWYKRTKGKPTHQEVTCRSCIAIVRYVQSADKEQFK